VFTYAGSLEYGSALANKLQNRTETRKPQRC